MSPAIYKQVIRSYFSKDTNVYVRMPSQKVVINKTRTAGHLCSLCNHEINGCFVRCEFALIHSFVHTQSQKVPDRRSSQLRVEGTKSLQVFDRAHRAVNETPSIVETWIQHQLLLPRARRHFSQKYPLFEPHPASVAHSSDCVLYRNTVPMTHSAECCSMPSL